MNSEYANRVFTGDTESNPMLSLLQTYGVIDWRQRNAINAMFQGATQEVVSAFRLSVEKLTKESK